MAHLLEVKCPENHELPFDHSTTTLSLWGIHIAALRKKNGKDWFKSHTSTKKSGSVLNMYNISDCQFEEYGGETEEGAKARGKERPIQEA
jgi:hypothetical protein